MTIVELLKVFAEPLDVAVLVTDIDLERPGPTILYANPAFARMSGYTAHEVLGNSPRLLQSSGTNSEATRMVARSLRAEGRFRGGNYPGPCAGWISLIPSWDGAQRS